MDNRSNIKTLKAIRKTVEDIYLMSSEYGIRSECSKLTSYIDKQLEMEEGENSPVCGDSVTTPNQDNVNHPSHYTWLKELCGIEVIDITRHMDFCLGCVLKYVLRAGKKKEMGLSDIEKEIEDLSKAKFYLNDKIAFLKNEQRNLEKSRQV